MSINSSNSSDPLTGSNRSPPVTQVSQFPPQSPSSQVTETALTNLAGPPDVIEKNEANLRQYAYVIQEANLRLSPSSIGRWISEIMLKLQCLFGIAPSSEARIQANRSLLGSLVRGSPEALDCKRSILIDYVKKHYEEIQKKNPSAEKAKFIEELRVSKEIAAWIEKLQDDADSSAENPDFKSLVKYVNASIDNLKSGEKLLLPSGYFRSESEFQDGMIEITKGENDACQLRYISLDEEIADHVPSMELKEKEKRVPYLKFNDFSIVALKELTPALLEAQMLGKFKIDSLSLITGSSTSPKIFSSLEILSVHGNPTLPDLEKEKVMRMGDDSPYARTMLAYLKINRTMAEHKEEKLHLELSAFNQIYYNSKDLFEASPQLRDECYDAGRRLCKRVDKQLMSIDKQLMKFQSESINSSQSEQFPGQFIDLKGNDHYKLLQKKRQYFEGELKKVTTALGELHELQLEGQKINTSIESWKIADAPPAEIPITLTPPSTLDGLEPLAAAASSKQAVIDKVNIDLLFHPLDLDPNNFAANLSEKLQVCQQLYTEGNYALLRSVVPAIVSQLPVPAGKHEEIWSKLPDKRVETIQGIQDSIFVLFQLNFDLQRLENLGKVPPECIITATKLKVIHDHLNWLKEVPKDDSLSSKKEAEMRKYFFPISSSAEELKKSSFLTLENSKQGCEIQQIKDYDERKNYKRSDWSNLSSFGEKWAKFLGKKQLYANIYSVRMPPAERAAIAAFEGDLWEGRGEAALPPAGYQQWQMRDFIDLLITRGGTTFEQGDWGRTIDQKEFSERIARFKKETPCVKKEGQKLRPFTTLTYIRDNPESVYKFFPFLSGDDPKPVVQFFGFTSKFGSKTSKLSLHSALTKKFRETTIDDPYILPGQESASPLDKIHSDSRNRIHSNQPMSSQQERMQQANKSDEVKELSCLNSSSSIVQVELTLGLFQKRPEYFRNPIYLKIFEANVFGAAALLAKIQDKPQSAADLLLFFREQYHLADAQNNIHDALIFLDLQIRVREYVEYAKISGANKDKNAIQQFDNAIKMAPTDEGALEKYDALLQRVVTVEEKYAVLKSKLLFQAKLLKERRVESLDPIQVIPDFLNMRQVNPSKAEWSHSAEVELEQLMTRMALDAKETLEDDQTLKTLFQDVGVSSSEISQKSIKRNHPQYICGEYTVDIWRGLILKNGVTRAYLPEDPLTSKILREMGLKEVEIACELEIRVDKKSGKEVMIYTPSAKPDCRILRREGESPVVQREATSVNGKKGWYEFTEGLSVMPPELHKLVSPGTPPPASALFYNRHAWVNIADPTQIQLSNHQGEIEYSVKLREFKPGFFEKVLPAENEGKFKYTIESVTRVKDNLHLMNPWETDSAALGQIPAIEAKEHIYVWGKNGRPQEITYPRLISPAGEPLTYIIDYSGGKEPRLKDPLGFELPLQRPAVISRTRDGEEFIDYRRFETDLLPVTFGGYQYLHNDGGDRGKVLIPLQPLRRSAHSPDSATRSWFNRASFNFSPGNITPQKYVELEVDMVRHTLTATSKEGNAMAAYVYFAHQNYDLAIEFLKKSETSEMLEGSHAQIIQWMKKWPDASIEGASFKLKVFAMEEKRRGKNGGALLPKSEKLEMSMDIQRLMEKYTGEYKSLPYEQRLTTSEQEQIDRCLSQIDLPISREKIKIKALEANELTRLVNTRTTLRESDLVWFITEIILNGTLSEKAPKSGVKPFTDQEFVENFKFMYQKVIDLNKEAPDLKTIRHRILFADPKDDKARISHSLLTALLREKENRANLNEFKWPQGDSPQELIKIRNQQDKPSNRIFNSAANFILTQSNVNRLPESNNSSIFDNKSGFPSKLKTMLMTLNSLPPAKKSSQKEKTPKNLSRREKNQKELLTFLQTEKAQIEEKIPKDKPSTSLMFDVSPPTPLFSEPLSSFNGLDSTSVASCCSEDDCDFLKNSSAGVPATTRLLCQELYDDTKAFIETNSGENAPKTYSFQAKTIEDLKTRVSQERENLQNAQGKVEKEIVNFLRSKHRGHTKSILVSGMAKVPKRMIGLYAEGKISPKSVKKEYGITASADECKALEEKVLQYMKSTVALNASIELEKKVKGLPSAVDQIPSDVAGEIQARLSTRRYFDPVVHPLGKELLTIEFENGYCLRKEQVNTIEALFSERKKDLNGVEKGIVKQLGMGAGKSSVLLPLLLNRYADGYHLAIGLLPDSLIEIVSKDLDESCVRLFGKTFYRLEFNRASDTSEVSLLKMYNHLGNAICSREPIIAAKNDLLSIRNKFIEVEKALDDKKITAETKQKLQKEQKVLADILTLLKTHSRAIADEVNVIFNVRQELNFAIGEAPLSEIKRKLGVDIYRKMVSWKNNPDPELQDFAHRLLNNQLAGATEQSRQKARKQIAVEYATEYLSQPSPPEITEELLVKYLIKERLTDEEQVDLNQNDQGVPAFMLGLENENTRLHTEICYLRQFIGNDGTTHGTLRASDNVHHGRSEDGITTIPYKASNTPTNAEFGDSFERIAYSCQDYLQGGISRKQVEKYLEGIFNAIKKEMEDRLVEEGVVLGVKETTFYARFKELYPTIDLQKAMVDRSEREKLRTSVNQIPASELRYLEDSVLPKYQMAQEQIRSNGNDLAEMLGEINGFSGIPAGRYGYPDSLDIEDAIIKGTDGKSVAFLLEAAQSGNLTIRSATIDPENPLASLCRDLPDFKQKYNVLIDTGAIMKGVSNQQVAEELSALGATSCKPVAYVDDKGDKRLIEKTKADAPPTISTLGHRLDVSAEERMTYYDQAHTTGTDIFQAPKARALVTIGEDLTLESLFQGMWRMRQLGKGQQIDLLVTQDVRKLIVGKRQDGDEQSEVTVQEIILFCLNNQAEVQAENCLRSEKDKITGKVPQVVLRELIKLRSASDDVNSANLFSHAQSLWIDPVEEDLTALSAIGGKEETMTALKNLKANLVGDPEAKGTKGSYQKIFEKIAATSLPKHVSAAVSTAIEVTQKRQPLEPSRMPAETPKIATSTQNSEMITQQQQQQTQTQMQSQVNVEMFQSTAVFNTSWSAWYIQSGLSSLFDMIPTLPTQKYSNNLNGFADIFDKKIYLSHNFVKNLYAADPVTNKNVLLPNRNRVGQAVIIRSPSSGDWQMCLLDVVDYEGVVRRTIKDSKKKDIYSRDLDFEMAVLDLRPSKSQCLISSAENNEPPWGDDQKEWRRLLVQAKLFGGEIHFRDKKDQEALQEWYARLTPAKQARLRALVETQFIDSRDRESYPTSFLGKLLLPKSP